MANFFKKKIVIIDSHALIHRSYHALPPLTTKSGQVVNAVYGFSSVLLKVIKELKPDYILAAFDLEAKTFRHRAYEAYKANRKKADGELYEQIPIVQRILKEFNIPCLSKEGFEADDIIGAIVKKLVSSCAEPNLKDIDKEIIIVTGDLDTLQLVNPATKVLTLKKGITDTVIYDEKAILDKYGLTPAQVTDFKGLKGDSSDNIPGVPSVGEKTAITLVKTFGNIENLYKELEDAVSRAKALGSKKSKEKINAIEIKGVKITKKILDNLLQFKDQAFFSKELATINCDIPLDLDWEQLKYVKDFNKEEIINIFEELEFYSLVGRMRDFFKEAEEEKENRAKEPKDTPNNKDDRYRNMLEEASNLYTQGLFSKKIYDLEIELIPVIQAMEEAGVCLDTAHLLDLSKSLSFRISVAEKKVYGLVGEEFNLNSPLQLSKILFEKLNISPKGLRKTPKGVIISTNAKELFKLKDSHPVISFILEFRELSKLRSTYTDSLIKMVDKETGRLHTKFNPLGTVTGRISSSGPNLQNIPIRTELGNEIRKAFGAQEGYVLLSADYSQLELRIIAALASDSNMKQAFLEGKDIHSLTAATINKIPLEEVTPRMRNLAKALNFGVTYGMGVNGFAESSGTSRQEAKEFIEKYRRDFPQVANYIEYLKELARQNGYSQTLFGRKRFLPELNSRNFHLRRAAERMAVNMPVQGTAADIVKMAMVDIHSYLSRLNSENIKIPKARLLLQVHDELVFEVEKERVDEVAQSIASIMEKVDQLDVPLKVELKTGSNWGQMDKIS